VSTPFSQVTGGAGIGRIAAMLRTTKIIAAAAVMSWASVASASEEHTILVLPDAFFPEVTYVKAGDKVRFVNLQAGSTNIIAKGDEWEVGPLGTEGEDLISISGSMETVFFDADQQNEEGEYSLKGSLSFEPAPLN
ncbi:MAG: hypothetical protein ABJ246_12125, partial [Paracoccaceae bacterium]